MQEEILNLIHSRGPQTVAVLAKSLKVSPRTVQRAVKKLIDAGTMTRNADASYDVSAKEREQLCVGSVEELIEKQSEEINSLAEKETKGKTEKVLGFRKGTKAAEAAEILMKEGEVKQAVLSAMNVGSNSWIKRVVKNGFATFNAETRVVTLKRK